MRIKRTEQTVYRFNELSEKAQDKAIEKLYDLNVGYEWWNNTYEDAERVGLKIKGFDLERGNSIEGILSSSLTESVTAILTDHGEICETYQLAKRYKEVIDVLDVKRRLGLIDEDSYNDQIDELQELYLRELLQCYLSILRQEYDYQTSREAIIESIEANEYEFDEEGQLA